MVARHKFQWTPFTIAIYHKNVIHMIARLSNSKYLNREHNRQYKSIIEQLEKKSSEDHHRLYTEKYYEEIKYIPSLPVRPVKPKPS